MRTPRLNEVTELVYRFSCADISISKWTEIMDKAVRADKREINKIVKKFCPEFYRKMALHLNTYYSYYKTSRYLIVVHSSIEYFFTFKTKE